MGIFHDRGDYCTAFDMLNEPQGNRHKQDAGHCKSHNSIQRSDSTLAQQIQYNDSCPLLKYFLYWSKLPIVQLLPHLEPLVNSHLKEACFEEGIGKKERKWFTVTVEQMSHFVLFFPFCCMHTDTCCLCWNSSPVMTTCSGLRVL